MTDDIPTAAADAALFARLRAAWSDVDPVPVDLVDRMVAAVAVADLTREYEMLTLVETAGVGAVRGESDTLTLQFSDGAVNVLLHVTADAEGTRRVDGWVDAAALAVTLTQGVAQWSAELGEGGRFAFDAVTPGVARIRMVLRGPLDAMREFQTPQFEV